MTPVRIRGLAWALPAALALVACAAHAETLAGHDLVKALRTGGYVIVMRHARSPQTPPTPAKAEPGNSKHERQLDAAGRSSATAMGEAMRRLHIRIGAVWSSPTYRALETVRLARLPNPKTAPELGDQGHSMQAVGADQGARLKAKADESPTPGTDTLVVTHIRISAPRSARSLRASRTARGSCFEPCRRSPHR